MKQQINDMQQKLIPTTSNEYQTLSNERTNSIERSTKM